MFVCVCPLPSSAVNLWSFVWPIFSASTGGVGQENLGYQPSSVQVNALSIVTLQAGQMDARVHLPYLRLVLLQDVQDNVLLGGILLLQYLREYGWRCHLGDGEVRYWCEKQIPP